MGEAIDFNGIQADTTGNYMTVLTNTLGCDSIIFLDLIVLSSDTIFLETQICQGDSYLFDSLDLTSTGIYIDTTTAINGCDSFTILNLNVIPSDSTFFGVAICDGQSYTFDTLNITEAGTYTQTLLNSQGCDSLLILELTVFQND